MRIILSFRLLLLTSILWAQPSNSVSKVWVADNGNGTFTNPILHADYSDPDVIRVGNDYLMTASSFNCVPGLPILHSKDLVNWQLISYALPKLSPDTVYNTVQHGGGVWAPCIRFVRDSLFIFYPDPDYGIYMVKAKVAKGPWTEPHLVVAGKGLIDPSPLWDDDGKAYLTYAFAGSRAGVKSVLMVSEMLPDGTALTGQPVMVFDGHEKHPTVEGPKFYKRRGFYYIFAPAGGVTNGWQLALRSRNVWGPYESRIVMAQGETDINGPHQGAWVTTPSGDEWFLHFQDLGAYGRVVHLNPMKWINDWPVIGNDKKNTGSGEPVRTHRKPYTGSSQPKSTPPDNDECNGTAFGLQWQWHANPQPTWGYASGGLGYYRLNCVPRPADYINMWNVSNLFLQKLPAPVFTATAKITFHARADEEEAGLIIMGMDYALIGIKRLDGKLMITSAVCNEADKGKKESIVEGEVIDTNTIYLRVSVAAGGLCRFYWSTDNRSFQMTNNNFTAREGKWIGAKVGFYALRNGTTNDAGGVDVDWFRVEK